MPVKRNSLDPPKAPSGAIRALSPVGADQHRQISIAAAYERDFGLSIPQWRVMAVLARNPGLSAAEVAARTAMDKVAVSRAVQGLLAAGRLRARHDVRRPAPHASAAVERRAICIHTCCADGARIREAAARRAQHHATAGRWIAWSAV